MNGAQRKDMVVNPQHDRRLTLNVGLSNMLDEEIKRREPAEGPHRQVVGAAVMNSELFLKVIQREERVESIKALDRKSIV